MATRQYIGARYVPKVFNNNGSNEWVSGIAYEALTIVTYLENSYTSVKPVPSTAGAPNIAIEYWACTGNVQGIIGNLDDRMDAVEGEIDGINDDITAVNTKIDGVRKRKYIMGGDSYSITNFEHDGWIDIVNRYMGLTRGVNSFDARNAVTYYGGSFGAGTFLTQIQALYEDVIEKPEEITDICYFAGANEYAQTSENINLGIKNFMDYAKVHFPNARVMIGFIGNLATTTKADLNNIYRALDIYKKCGSHGACYCTNIEYVNQNFRNYHDGIHPNDYSTIAAAIVTGIRSGSVDFVSQGAVYSNNGVNLGFTCVNGNAECELTINKSGLSAVEFTPHYNNATTEIADFGMRINELQHDIYGYVKAVYGTPSHFFTADMIIKVTPEGKVYASVCNYNDSNGSTLTITGSLIIMRQKITYKNMVTIPAWY